MVHLEVTGKENRALCITNRDRDMHGEALRTLDKGLSKHVQNLIHFLFSKVRWGTLSQEPEPAVTVKFC